MLDTITNTEFAFRKCGTLASHVFNPFAPMIRRPKEFIKSGLKHKIDTHAIVNILKGRFGNIIDCPLQLIPKIYTLHLTDRQKAHYFKVLYQAIPSNKTYSHMYTTYYKDTRITDIQSQDKRKFIYSCMNNNTPLNKLYENEYYKYSRYDSI